MTTPTSIRNSGGLVGGPWLWLATIAILGAAAPNHAAQPAKRNAPQRNGSKQPAHGERPKTATSRETAVPADNKSVRFDYPQARRSEQIDNYHGVEVADPYRWLEDPDSEETRAWIEAENKLTFSYLKQIPQRDAIEKRLTKLWNYEK